MDSKVLFKLSLKHGEEFISKFDGSNTHARLRLIYRYLNILADQQDYYVSYVFKSPLLVETEENKKRYDHINKTIKDFLYEISEIKNKETNDYTRYATIAQTYIGVSHEYGIFSFEKDHFKAFNYFNMASRSGDAYSIYKMGTCYEKGVGKTICYDKASTYYRMSAKLGLVQALHIYGGSLIHGTLDNKLDIQEGVFYLKMAEKAADKYYPYPCFDVAQLYEGDVLSDIKDVKYSFEIYTRGAMLGCHNCQYKMGKIFEYGQMDKEKNIPVALSWYRKSAENGHTDAQIALSAFYYTGFKGMIEKNSEMSLKWAQTAAAQGDKSSLFTLGEFYEVGIGCERNVHEALFWYKVSFKKGNLKAEFKINEIERKFKDKKKNVESGIMSCCF